MAQCSSMAGTPLAMRPCASTRGGRTAFSVQCKESRIGKAPIKIPPGVTYTVEGQLISVKGPRGELTQTIPPLLHITQESDGFLRLKTVTESRKANELHGLFRTLTDNMMVGTSTGFTRVLQLIGVGYRASVAGTQLTLNLGFSHPVVFDIPSDLSVAVEKNTLLTITGIDKVKVGDFAAKIRNKRPPEPYKGKGVRYVGEFIRRKEGKRGK